MPTDSGSETVVVAASGSESLTDLGTTDSTAVFTLEQSVNVIVTNVGTKYVWPLIFINGACKNPRISNLTVGRTLAWYNLEMVDGDVLEVDCRKRTSLLNGEVVTGCVPNVAEYFPLIGGDNEIQTGGETVISGSISMQVLERR